MTENKTRAYISFPGLYETSLDPRHADESYREYATTSFYDENPDVTEDEISAYWDECDRRFSFSDYAEKIGAEYAAEYESMLNDIPELKGIKLEFAGIDSPREYNFSTDACAVIISEADLRRVRKYAETIAIEARYGEEKIEISAGDTPDGFLTFSQYIERRLAPRDGFIPFYSNDVRTWGAVSTWGAAQLECLFDFVLSEREVMGFDYPNEHLILKAEELCAEQQPDFETWLAAYRAERAEEEAEESAA